MRVRYIGEYGILGGLEMLNEEGGGCWGRGVGYCLMVEKCENRFCSRGYKGKA